MDLGLIDPADVRRDMGLLNQNAHLFFGKRCGKNLKLGANLGYRSRHFNGLKMTGLWILCWRKEGLDHQVLEGGAGFSADNVRLYSRHGCYYVSRILCCSMNRLQPWMMSTENNRFIIYTRGRQKTLVIATHRRAVLELVDRIIVLQDGKIVMDGSKQQILQQSVSNQAEATA